MPTSKKKITPDEFRAFAVAMAPTNPPPKPMTDDKRYTLLLVQNTAENEGKLLDTMRRSTKWGAKDKKPVAAHVVSEDGGVMLESVIIATPIFRELADALIDMYERGAVYQLNWNADEIKVIKPAVPLAEGNAT